MKRAVIPCCALALALAGCASVRPLPAHSSGDPDERLCSVERPTGSHQYREVCRTREELERERERAEHLLHRGLQVGEIIIY